MPHTVVSLRLSSKCCFVVRCVSLRLPARNPRTSQPHAAYTCCGRINKICCVLSYAHCPLVQSSAPPRKTCVHLNVYMFEYMWPELRSLPAGKIDRPAAEDIRTHVCMRLCIRPYAQECVRVHFPTQAQLQRCRLQVGTIHGSPGLL